MHSACARSSRARSPNSCSLPQGRLLCRPYKLLLPDGLTAVFRFNPLSLQRSESTAGHHLKQEPHHVSILSRSNGARALFLGNAQFLVTQFQSSLAPTEREHGRGLNQAVSTPRFNPLSLQRSESTGRDQFRTHLWKVSILSRSNGARALRTSGGILMAAQFQSSLAPTEREHH